MVVIVSMRETHVTVHRVRILAAVRHYLLMMEGHLVTDVTVNMDIKVCYCHTAVTMLMYHKENIQRHCSSIVIYCIYYMYLIYIKYII